MASMRSAGVVDSGGKMAAVGDAAAPGLNGLIQQFTSITGTLFINLSVIWTISVVIVWRDYVH